MVDGDDVSEKEDLEEIFSMSTMFVNETQTDYDLKVIQPKLEFVQHEPPDVSDFFRQPISYDKLHAVVVAGESGSGKSVFSCLKPMAEDFEVLHVNVASHIMRKQVELAQRRFPEWSHFLQIVVDAFGIIDYNSAAIDGPICQRVLEFKSSLNMERNQVAQDIARAALEESVKDYAKTSDGLRLRNAVKWLEGRYGNDSRPSRLAIVLDEATSLDFTNGIIDSIRAFSTALRQELVQEGGRLLVILAGTSLDAINQPETIGSDASKSRLIVMRAPNAEAIQNSATVLPKSQLSTVMKAIDRGSHSRVLKDNSRMYFNGVLPIMLLRFLFVDNTGFTQPELKERLYQRLLEVGSVPALMDYAVRLYLKSNSLGSMNIPERDQLLKQAFVYHLERALSEAHDSSNYDGAVLESIRSYLRIVRSTAAWKNMNRTKYRGGDIFTKGIASRNSTSLALRYLACAGQSTPLRIGNDGKDFEKVVALHVKRLMDVQDYLVADLTLQHGWPYQNQNGEYNKTSIIAELKKNLRKQAVEERAGVEKLLNKMKRSERFCVVFYQGDVRAQGWDVSVLYVTRNRNGSLNARLDPIQCKNTLKLKLADG